MEIEYDERKRDGHVKSVDGFHISPDKHAYRCKICGAIWQSKNIESRSVSRTDDPRCDECDDMNGDGNNVHPLSALRRICNCEPIV